MKKRFRVGILGATGAVGQQFVSLLQDHPWFQLSWVGASERTAGNRYGDLPWRMPDSLTEQAAGLTVEVPKPGRAPRLLFSALDAAVAGDMEEAFASAGHTVLSNARNHRMDPLVPLLIPEINPDHLQLLTGQRNARKWEGAIVTNPNCSTMFLTLALAALRDFEPEQVLVNTLQALSGAGYPGTPSLDALGNVIPFIPGEEEKMESETKKILGELQADQVSPHPMTISAQATRVPVLHGHTELLSVSMKKTPSREELLAAFLSFRGKPQELGLPSAPPQPIIYTEAVDRPQPRWDVEKHNGMAVHIGRLRACPVLDYKFVVLGHNTIRGAAGAAVLNAELMYSEGWLGES
jgi:aspartate-semialdehyde dehydrogenase